MAFRKPQVHYGWIVLLAVGVVMLAGSGVRASFGIFIRPMEEEFGWSRTSLSLVASLSLVLYGAVGPLVGRFSDRWGPRSVLAAAAVLLGLGTLGSSAVSSLPQFFFTAGVVTSIGAGGAALSVAATAVVRWFDARRGLALGAAGAGVAAGQLLIVPLVMAVTVGWGWRQALVVLSVGMFVLILPFVLLLVRNSPQEMGLTAYGATEPHRVQAGVDPSPERTSIRQAVRTLPFWLLAGSFWVCGYTTSGLILTHLIPHATEHGFYPSQAAQALGIMGALNIVGVLASGWLCDRFHAKLPLAGYYLLRGVSLLFLPLVGTLPGLFAFAAVYGLNYISTVPATTSLTARIYGRYSVGELSGWIFLSHQIGAASGAFFGGYIYDHFHDYTIAFHSGTVLAFVAVGLVLLIPEKYTYQKPEIIASTPSAVGY